MIEVNYGYQGTIKIGSRKGIKKIRKALEKVVTRCAYCGEEIKGRGTFDHFLPKSLGGKDRVDNAVLSCNHCNTIKDNMLPKEWFEKHPESKKYFRRYLWTFQGRTIEGVSYTNRLLDIIYQQTGEEWHIKPFAPRISDNPRWDDDGSNVRRMNRKLKKIA